MDRRRRTTWGDVAARRARASLVGRRAERELVRSALEAETPECAAIWFTGPGGIGKSTLLDAVADDTADRSDRCVVRIDGTDAAGGPADLRAALATVADDGGRALVLIDGYEHLSAIDDLVRTELLPSLPSDALVVVASRTPPGAAWRADPGWRDLVRVVALRNLDATESEALLAARGVRAAQRRAVVERTHGHPLALALVADVVAAGGDLGGGPLPPRLVDELVTRLVGVVPAGDRRRALEVCALARATNESLLRDVLGSDAATDAFRWLSTLSIVQQSADGLVPHEMAREVLHADLRWRDPETHDEVFRSVRRHVHGRLRRARGAERVRAAADLKYLFRHLRSVLAPVEWTQWGAHHPEPASPSERTAVVELVAVAEGPESAAIAGLWFDHQPGAVHVLRRTDGGVQGTLFLLDLTAAPESVRDADPVASSAWAYVHRQAPPRPGERVTTTRFVIDRDAYQGPSPTLNAAPIATLLRYLDMPDLAWDVLVLHEPDAWDEYFAAADLHRASGADAVVGGRRYGLFAHDFRRVPVDDMVELWTERALADGSGATPEAPPGVAEELVVLSHADFARCVRDALRDLHRPDRLAGNALLSTRVARDHADGDRPTATSLGALLGRAVDDLGSDPRDEKARRALDRTYLRPAGSQEAAAEVLGLPFSTYRRHLAHGRDRIVAWLWQRELHGPGPP